MINIPLETIPAAIGAGVFMVHVLVKYLLQVPVTKQQIVEEPNSEWEDYFAPEPAPEPNLEEEKERKTKNGILHAMLLLIVCITALYFLQDMPADSHVTPAWHGEEQENAILELKSLNHTASPLPAVAMNTSELKTQVPKVGTEDAKVTARNVNAAGLVSAADGTEMALQAASATMPYDLVSEAPLIVPVHRIMIGEGTEEEYVRSAYYATLKLGSPHQLLSVVFDTGSGQVVLPSSYCASPTCKMKRRYRRSSSQTGRDINFDGSEAFPGVPRDTMTVTYGTGQVTGVVVEDVVCMKDTAETVALNQSAARKFGQGKGLDPGCVTMRFVAATRLAADPFESFPFDGIVGLGLQGLSQNRNFNFMQILGDHLHDLGSNMPNTFGMFLANAGAETSEIAFGGWTSSHALEPISWRPIDDPETGHWIIPVRGLRINGQLLDFCKDGTCKAAVDSGTSLLSVPSKVFPRIFEKLRYQAPKAGHCLGSGPLLQIELERFTIVLGPREYASIREERIVKKKKLKAGNIDKPQGRTDLRCFPTLMSMDFVDMIPKLFILGEPVLRKYYTVYDAQEQRVGIARAAHRSGPKRDELLLRLPDVVGPQKSGRAHPTMFDIFRWRIAMKQVCRHL